MSFVNITLSFRSQFEKLMINILKRFVEVTDKMVFTSYPDYSDNALALTEYIIRNDDLRKYKIYWIVDNPSCFSNQKVNGVFFCAKKNRFGLIPLKTLKVHLQARYVFATHAFLIPEECAKTEQKYILLWHGCGFKTKVGTKYTLFDKALVPGALFVESKSKYWNVKPDKIIDQGYPRYDWMLHPSHIAKEYFRLLKNDYSKVIFWLPTFRNSVSNKAYPENTISQFPILAKEEEWKELSDFLISRNILLVLKLHNSQKAYSIPFEKFANVKVLDHKELEREGVRLYELFPFSDGLITDYSSVSFDYLVVDKPICYTLDDYKIYKSTRGFIFDHPIDYMPGHHVYNLQELKTFLEDLVCGCDDYKQKREEARKVAVAKAEFSYSEQILKALEVI